MPFPHPTCSCGAAGFVTAVILSTTGTNSIDTTGWSAGRHTIFVEGKDANGNWGVPTANCITIN